MKNNFKVTDLKEDIKLNLGFGGFSLLLSIINFNYWKNIKGVDGLEDFAVGNLKNGFTFLILTLGFLIFGIIKTIKYNRN